MKERLIIDISWVSLIILILSSFGISQNVVDFESQVLGTEYGITHLPPNAPGDFIFSENGIDVFVREFYSDPTTTTFNFCRVEPPFPGFGSGNKIMNTNNINLEFYFGFLGFNVDSVSFEFADMGGIENMSLGTLPPYIGELTGYTQPPGINFTISTTPIAGGIRGTVTLSGSIIDTLIVGGQELLLDNITAWQTVGIHDGESQETMLPENFVLHQNFPNPFNPATTIRFEVPAGWNTPLTLQIFNLQGQLVKTLIDDVKLSPGTHGVVWDGKDSAGKQMSSGIYFSRLTSGGFGAVKKMLVAK
jgi:hypothetical protein